MNLSQAFAYEIPGTDETGVVVALTEKPDGVLYAVCIPDSDERVPKLLDLGTIQVLEIPGFDEDTDAELEEASEKLEAREARLREIFDVVTTKDPSEEIHKAIAQLIAEEIDITAD